MYDPHLMDIEYAEVYVDSTGMLWAECSYAQYSSLTTLDTPEANVFYVNTCMQTIHIERVVETML